MVIVIKNDHTGHEVWRYSGRILARGTTWIKLEAFFNRPDVDAGYHIFREGDRFVELFYSDRWYNIFTLYDVDDDHLKGWYCNVTRPAQFDGDTVRADDLALDVFVKPDGTLLVLDQDEFADLPLSNAVRDCALHALNQITQLVETRQPPFDVLSV